MAIAVVTGSSTGIGQATAVTLARAGHIVYATMRNPEVGGEELRVVASKENLPLRFAALDVNSDESVQTAFAGILAEAGRIDVLVNNAGIAHGLGPADQLTLETWRGVIDTNLTGMFLCTREALKLMRSGGTIVNNISVAAVQPFEGMAAYNASKYGALGFTNALRLDLRKRGIRVLALMPGATDTAIWDQFWADAPREKMLCVETVAEAVVHVVALPPEATIEEIRIGPASGVL